MPSVVSLASVVVGGLASLCAGLAGFLTSRRTHSGRVDGSDAATIFAAGESLRRDLVTELVATRRERDECWQREGHQ